MKKSLIALAVIAVSSTAFAQSSVTLYGLVDANIAATRDQVGSAKVTNNGINIGRATNGGLNTSRFGLKGSEDLGGGLKANFLLESGFDPSTGAAGQYTNPYTGVKSNSVFSRNSWVGLSGAFGEVKLGKMWTAYDEMQGLGAAGFNSNAFAPANNVWASNDYEDRPGNAIHYVTPNMGGFTAMATYSFGENKTGTVGAGHIASVSANYAGGPVAVALAYQVQKIDGSVTDPNKFLQLNASYDLGVVKFLGAAGRVKDGKNALGLAVEKTQEYQLGVDVPLGSFTLTAGYAWSKDDQIGNGPEIKHKGLGLAGKYALSKRTDLYAGFQMAKQSEYLSSPSDKRRIIATGIRHTF